MSTDRPLLRAALPDSSVTWGWRLLLTSRMNWPVCWTHLFSPQSNHSASHGRRGFCILLCQRDLPERKKKSANQNFPFPLRLPTSALVSGKLHFHCNKTKAHTLSKEATVFLRGAFSPMTLTFRSFGAKAELSSSESEQQWSYCEDILYGMFSW